MGVHIILSNHSIYDYTCIYTTTQKVELKKVLQIPNFSTVVYFRNCIQHLNITDFVNIYIYFFPSSFFFKNATLSPLLVSVC